VHAWVHRHQEFEYDGLHRLKTARSGVRDGMTFTHASGSQASEQWDLDAIGNWNERRTWTGSAYATAETRQHSDANELTQRTLVGPVDLDLTYVTTVT